MAHRTLAPPLPVLALLLACGDAPEPPPPPLTCDAATGEPLDLVPHARLTASGARAETWPWPREAEDAIATIRDDDPLTSWKPPAEGGTVSIDLQPWLGRPVALATIALAEGDAVGPARVRVSEACGARAIRTFEWADPTAPLDLEGVCAACVELEVPAGTTELHGLSVTSRDAAIAVPALAPADVSRPAEGLAHVGVIEGFYGVPWSFRERRHMVATLARLGFDTYVYGPKNDERHRDRWREAYPAAWMAQFADLAAFATAVDVDLIYAITPFVDYGFDDADYAALLAKLRGFADVGVAGVALFADDIEFAGTFTVDAALGAQHAAVVQRLYDDLRADHPELAILFVPTVYSDARAADFPDGPGYLSALAALPADVPIMWTGTDTFSPTLAPADLAAVTGWIGRAPFIWDNYWANDGGDDFLGHLVLAPLAGRGAALMTSALGIGFNMSIQGGLSRLSLATAAAQLRADGDLAPAVGREHAALVEQALATGAGADAAVDRAAAALVMELFEADTNGTPHHARLDAAIAALSPALAGGVPVTQVRPLLLALAELAVLRSLVHHGGLDVDLVDDLAYPLLRADLAADLGLAVLELYGERLAGRDGDDARAAASAAGEAAAGARFRFRDDGLRDLLAAVNDLPATDRGFVAIGRGATPATCTTGDTLQWTPFSGADGAELSILGLPGATIDAGAVRWTPPHAGTWRAVAVATRDGERPGWGVHRVELVCGLPRD